MPPKLEAVFFATSAGREPVRDWLLTLSNEERKAIGTDIAYVQWKRPIGKPHVDHVRGGIWEIRSTLKGRIARVLFTVTAGEMVLLHGFVKTTQRTPGAEIELAQCRWKEWQDAQAQ